MKTIKNYTGDKNEAFGYKITKRQLRHRTDVIIDVLQALIDRIALKEGIRIGIRTNRDGYELYEKPLNAKDKVGDL